MVTRLHPPSVLGRLQNRTNVPAANVHQCMHKMIRTIEVWQGVIGQYNEAVASRVRILVSGIARDLATNVLIGHCPGCTDGQGASTIGVHSYCQRTAEWPTALAFQDDSAIAT